MWKDLRPQRLHNVWVLLRLLPTTSQSALASDRLRTARHCDAKQVMSTHRMIRYPCQPFPWLLIEKCAIDPQLQEGAPAKSRRGVHSWLRQYASVTKLFSKAALLRPNHLSFEQANPRVLRTFANIPRSECALEHT